MAKMIPPYIHRDVKSAAEKKLFSYIENDSSLKDWVCLHSLGLAKHISKTEGEVDFLLIGPPGIFCLEVKGGRVERKDGIWYFSDRYGVSRTKSEGPFKQVSSANFSLINVIKHKFEHIGFKTLFGYGVLFPDCDFKVDSIEWDKKIVYDLKDRLKSFSVYIKRLVSHWQGKHPQKSPLNKTEINDIVNFLRGDFEFIQPLNVRFEEIEAKIISLTEQQYKALDRMDSNKRVLFKGTAGTGKTLLAIEKGKRLSLAKQKVLFLCFNTLLGKKLKSYFQDFPERDYITADSLHSFFYSKIKVSSYEQAFVNDHSTLSGEDLYKKAYPDYFVKTLLENPLEYDYLIIDEGQDLLSYEYFTALDYVLKGGLEYGNWIIFYDPTKQGELFGTFDETLVDNLKGFGAAEYRLDINCRNTKPIATAAAFLSGYELENTLIEEGEPVKYLFYEDNDSLLKKISQYITELYSKGVSPSDITLLYPTRQMEELLQNLETSYKLQKLTSENIHNFPSNKISYCSVQAYKGLENRVVILVGIEELESDWISSVNYVGMTRARQLLVICAKAFLKDSIRKKFLDLL